MPTTPDRSLADTEAHLHEEGMGTAPEWEMPDMSKFAPVLLLATAVGGIVLLVSVAHFTPLGAVATVALLGLLILDG
jgi:hypothetical protein